MVNYMLLVFVIVNLLFSSVYCIVTKNKNSSKLIGKVDGNKKDNVASAQSLERGSFYGGGHHSDDGFGAGYGGHYGGGYDGGGFEGGFDHGYVGDSKYHGYDRDEHGHGHGHGHDHGYHKALAIKGLLVPLAGVALLGAAAAFISNPILLQIGVISGQYGVGKRKRRDTNNNLALEMDESQAKLEAQVKLDQIQLLERFMSQLPKEEVASQEKKLLASYLTCTGIASENSCLERLTCELNSSQTVSMPIEAHVMSIVAGEILNNEYISQSIKRRVKSAAKLGSSEGDCRVYTCQHLEMRQGEEEMEATS